MYTVTLTPRDITEGQRIATAAVLALLAVQSAWDRVALRKVPHDIPINSLRLKHLRRRKGKPVSTCKAARGILERLQSAMTAATIARSQLRHRKEIMRYQARSNSPHQANARNALRSHDGLGPAHGWPQNTWGKKIIRTTAQLREQLLADRHNALVAYFIWAAQRVNVDVTWVSKIEDCGIEHDWSDSYGYTGPWSMSKMRHHELNVSAMELKKSQLPDGERTHHGLHILGCVQVGSWDGVDCYRARWARKVRGTNWVIVDGWIANHSRHIVHSTKSLDAAIAGVRRRVTIERNEWDWQAITCYTPDQLQDYRHVRVTIQHARKVGLCMEGIKAFCHRCLDREPSEGATIGTILRLADEDSIDLARRACMEAARTQILRDRRRARAA